ncbi:unnamed protein product [Prorocentrum cordatum]|uniref:Uncharacterized protein n=1 Tax=Prorocentrum cordatum TaxID=2364126 RepID=A0ABN9TKT0_9DINO|nr:unnamed protein product [Polarella glacialis]
MCPLHTTQAKRTQTLSSLRRLRQECSLPILRQTHSGVPKFRSHSRSRPLPSFPPRPPSARAMLWRLPPGVGLRVAALLPVHAAAAFSAACSPAGSCGLAGATSAVRRWRAARQRVAAAAQALQSDSGLWTEPRKRRQLSDALERLEKDAAAALAALLSRLQRGLPPSPRPAQMPDELAAAELAERLQDANALVCCAAARALAQLGTAAAPSAPALARAARAGAPQARLQAVEALGRLGPAASGAAGAEAVAAALADPCPHVCARAVQALGRLGAGAAGGPAALLGSGDRYVRARAASALGRLGASAAAHAGALEALLADGHEDVRGAARRALLNIAGGQLALPAAARPSLPLVAAAQAEWGYDLLEINGKSYSGTLGPNGVLPLGAIVWSSDEDYVASGWKLCQQGDASDSPGETALEGTSPATSPASSPAPSPGTLDSNQKGMGVIVVLGVMMSVGCACWIKMRKSAPDSGIGDTPNRRVRA